LVFLDFDGVLCDSIRECLVVGLEAYNRVKGNAAPAAWQTAIDPSLDHFFRRHRWLVQPAGQYYVLFDSYFRSRRNLKPDRFADELAQMANDIAAFEEAFFDAREDCMSWNLGEWLKLNPLYPGTGDALWGLQTWAEMRIVTTKDEASVLEIAQAYGLPLLSVFGRNAYRAAGSKRAMIGGILKKEDRPISSTVFLDDNVTNLIEVQPIGVRCFWATWGYSMPLSGVPNAEIIPCRDWMEFSRSVRTVFSL
jgi:phosphoglycolate phosphatase-like HAD superfamily hydrolase